MIPANSLLPPLQAYLKANPVPLVQLVDASLAVRALFTVGEQVHAQVAGLLPSGRYAVLVKDQLLDLNLPHNTEPGLEFDMEVYQTHSRLAFLLPKETLPTRPAHVPVDASTQVDLSKTALYLSGLHSQTKAPSTQAAVANPLQPNPSLFMAASHMDAGQLAHALQATLSQGGLFYESHLLQWLHGSRTLEQLQQEPPAHLARAEPVEKGGGKGPILQNSLALSQEVDVEVGFKPPVLASAQLGMQEQTLKELSGPARHLLQQQLQLIEQPHMQWQGQLWPGQALRWEVEADGHAQTMQEESTKVWYSRIQLELPELGALDIALRLSGTDQLEVSFNVEKEHTRQLLEAGQVALADQLAAAGLELRALSASTGEAV